MPIKFVTNEGGVFVISSSVEHSSSGDSSIVVVEEAFDDTAEGSSDLTETSVVDEPFVLVVNVEEALLEFVEGAEDLSVIARRLWWSGRIGVTSSMLRRRTASCGASAATV